MPISDFVVDECILGLIKKIKIFDFLFDKSYGVCVFVKRKWRDSARD